MCRTYRGRIFAALTIVTETLYLLHGVSLAGDGAPRGLFIGDDPQFPFVLQFDVQGDVIVVQGAGQMPYSAADPTPVAVKFAALGSVDQEAVVRGTLEFQPDDQRLAQPRRMLWVAASDPDSGTWQLMLSPRHVLTTRRPSQDALRKDKPANSGRISVDDVLAISDDVQRVAQSSTTTIQTLTLLNNAHTAARDTFNRLPPETRTTVTHVADRLASHFNHAVDGARQLGNRVSQIGAAGISGPNSPPSTRARPSSSPDQSTIDNLRILLGGIESGMGRTGLGLLADNVFRPVTGVNTGPPPSRPRTPANAPPATAQGTNPGSPSPSPRTIQAVVQGLQGRPLDEVLAVLWGLGLNADQTTLTTAPDAGSAWQVTGLTILPDGRIAIVHHGSAPDGNTVQGGGSGSSVAGGTSAPSDRTVFNGSRNQGGSNGDVSNPGPPSSTNPTPPKPPGGSDVSQTGPNRRPADRPGPPPALPGLPRPGKGPRESAAAAASRELRELLEREVGSRAQLESNGEHRRNLEVTTVIDDDGSRLPDNVDLSGDAIVPNVVGMSVAEAIVALRSRGLKMLRRTYPRGSDIIGSFNNPMPGTVLMQAPAAGKSVKRGSEVACVSDDTPSGIVGHRLTNDDDVNDARRRFNDLFGQHSLAKGPGDSPAHSNSSLTSDQLAAARNALSRSTGSTAATGVGQSLHDSPNSNSAQPSKTPTGAPPKHDPATKLNGTWELVGGVGGVNAQATMVIRVEGELVHFSGSTTAGAASSSWTGQGTVRQEGSKLSGSGTASSPGAPTAQLKYSLSEDGKTLTFDSSSTAGSNTTTWRRR